MADTLPDITIQAGVWTDVYAVTGIVAGSPLIIKNKSNSTVFVQVRASQPDPLSNDGWDLRGSSAQTAQATWTTVDNVPGSSRVWVKGGSIGRLFVQVLED